MFPEYYARTENLSFGFYLVNFERGTYLAVDHSLVYSYSRMSLLFISLMLTLLEPGLQQYISTHISVSFCLLLLNLASCRTGIL